MLKDDDARLVVLEKASAAAKSGGFVLVADTPKHQRIIRSFFEDRSEDWVTVKDKKGFIFVQKSCALKPSLEKPGGQGSV